MVAAIASYEQCLVEDLRVLLQPCGPRLPTKATCKLCIAGSRCFLESVESGGLLKEEDYGVFNVNRTATNLRVNRASGAKGSAWYIHFWGVDLESVEEGGAMSMMEPRTRHSCGVSLAVELLLSCWSAAHHAGFAGS